MVNPEKYNDQITDYRKTILEFINRPEKEEDKLTIDDLVANDWKIKNNSFYILPSSVHELILVPYSREFCVEYFAGMVREINETQVEATEVLSDSIYFFDKETKC